jgi:TolB-like protein/Tfp pilus assembly protein PilF
MRFQQFLVELKGRRVYRVAAIYAAGSWALLQIADIFFPMLGLPDWAITSFLAVAALGFPIALVLAWLFDITPGGVVEADAVTLDEGPALLSPARLVELFLLLALVFLVGFLYIERLQPRGGEPDLALAGVDRASIAVLPFANMSDSPEMEYLGDGLAEEILNLLTKLQELDVAARTSSFYFKGRNVAVQEIAEKLGVRHVLEGSVRRQGDRVRVTAQLIDAASGFHLWSEAYDRKFEDSFQIQDEISRSVVDTLKLLLSDSSLEVLNRDVALVPEAFDFYLQGMDYFRRPSTENLQRALELFDRAIELDETFAGALAGRCRTYLEIYRSTADPLDFQGAETACQQALELDDRADAVYVALGDLYRTSGKSDLALVEYNRALAVRPNLVSAYLGLAKLYQVDNKPKLAEELLLEAIELQPSNWQTYSTMGAFLFASGRIEEAAPYFQRITELMPDNAIAWNNYGSSLYFLGEIEAATAAWDEALKLEESSMSYSNVGTGLFFLGRYDEAAERYQKAVEYAPEYFEYWGNLGDAYRFSTRYHELAGAMYRNAIKLALERIRINPSDADTLSLLGYYHANLGEREQALLYLARATALAPDSMYVQYSSAATWASLDEIEKGLAALEKAFDLGYARKIALVDATLGNLRQQPGFKELTR